MKIGRMAASGRDRKTPWPLCASVGLPWHPRCSSRFKFEFTARASTKAWAPVSPTSLPLRKLLVTLPLIFNKAANTRPPSFRNPISFQAFFEICCHQQLTN
eukprot:EG_transcript_44156